MKLIIALLLQLSVFALQTEEISFDSKWGTYKPNLYFAVTQRPTFEEYES